MNTQTIFNNTKCNISSRIEEFCICEADKIFYKNKYNIDSKVDLNLLKKLTWLKSIIDSDCCENSDYYSKIFEQTNLLLLNSEKIKF